MRILINAVAGLLFGLGLIVSGLANPAKVQNFLDLAGNWDPSLAFVMAGAIAVTFAGYQLAFSRGAPVFDTEFHLPKATRIDRRLALGALVFGVGWGLSGFCPGPAIVSLPLFAKGTVVFVAAMIAGIAAVRFGLGAAAPGATKSGAPTSEAAKPGALHQGALKTAKG
jgi:uncharacterized membrane protein YedE/YeeE